MRLYIIRHGSAEPSSPSGDFGRHLTEEGRRILMSTTFGLARIGVRFDHLFHSPMVRAAETAMTLDALVNEPPVELAALAQPPDESLLAELRRFVEGRAPRADVAVALVGHLPWVAELAAWLTVGRPLEAGAYIFSPGTVAALDGNLEPAGMRLSGLWQPGDLMS